MRYIKHISYILLLSLLVLPFADRLCAADGDGGYVGSYFQIPIGARPTAMGGAYLAVSDDGAAPMFNPAGIAIIKHKLFATSYRAMGLDRSLGYVTLLFPAHNFSAIGVNWHYFSSGNIATRNNDGRLTGGELSFNSHDFSVIFAKRFESYLSVGMRAGYLYSRFAEMSAFSVGIDLGMMLYLSQFFDREKRIDMFVKDWQLGVTVKNLGGNYRWNTANYNAVYGGSIGGVEQEDKFPVEVGLGMSARFFERKLLVAADILKNEKQDPFFHAGAEYFVSPEFALRSGYSDGRFTVGTGYMFKIGRQLLAIDYAFTTDKANEGSDHIFSFDFLF